MNEMTAAAGRLLPCGDSADARYCPTFWAQNAELEALRAERDRLRGLVTEILCTYAGDTGKPGILTSIASPGQRDRWRQRAGIGGGT